MTLPQIQDIHQSLDPQQAGGSLFASQLLLSHRDIKQLRAYDDYAIHRVVYSLFEDVRAKSDGTRDNSASAGFLYADVGIKHDYRCIIMLSNRQPRAKVSDRYGLVSSKAVPSSFMNHSRYRFQVVVNPVVQRKGGRREPLRSIPEIAQWFTQRAPGWGFSVDPLTIQATNPKVRRIKIPDGESFAVSQSIVSGALSVQDRTRFIQSFRSGIGRQRAFGCGLLQIKPIIQFQTP